MRNTFSSTFIMPFATIAGTASRIFHKILICNNKIWHLGVPR
jgi:hypothetical protein